MILTHKLNIWAYEEEERIFTTDGVYVPVQVAQVITGRVMSSQDFSMVRELVERIDPHIEIIRAEQVMDVL
jgi:ribosomal protein S3AE